MRSGRRLGFTLVELMVVIAIIAIMVGVGTPALLQSLPGMRVSGASRLVLSELRFARTRAVETGREVVVKFNVDQTGAARPGSFVLVFDDDLDGDFNAAGDTLIREVRLFEQYRGLVLGSNDAAAPAGGIGLDAGVFDAVTLRANGSASENGAVYLMPQADAGTTRHDRNRRVLVLQATGSVRIETFDGTDWL